MWNQDQAFNLSQRFPDDCIADDRKQYNCPDQECALPLLINVRKVICHDHSLFQRTGEESYNYHVGRPTSTYKPAKIIHEPWWANNFNAVTYLQHSSKILAKLERFSMEI